MKEVWLMFAAVYADTKGNAFIDERHLAVGRTGRLLSLLC
jgi:hypothetical protein